MSERKFFHATDQAAKWIMVWFIGMAVWWIALNAGGFVDTLPNYLYGLVLGLIPVVGGLVGLHRSKAWGGGGSAMGRAIGSLSVGLITWGVGTLIFAYYNIFAGIAVPYPSIADVFYLVSCPLWFMGVVFLSRATGVRFSLRKMGGKIQLFVIPLLVAVFSYYALVVVARQGVLFTNTLQFWNVFFDLAYPLADVFILTLVLLVFGLSYEHLGGRFKFPILILLFGFVVMYLADFSFSWTTVHETFFVSSWVDFLFTSAMTLISLGTVMLNPGLPKEGE